LKITNIFSCVDLFIASFVLVDIAETFATDASVTVTLKGCIKILFYPMCETINSGTACDMLEPTDKQDCGAIGAYEFSQSQDIPEFNVRWFMRAPSIRAEIYGVTECDFKMIESSSSGGAMIVGMSIVSTALLVSAFLFSKQRRNVETQEDEKATPFVEMSHV
jgi:hypothetical protein